MCLAGAGFDPFADCGALKANWRDKSSACCNPSLRTRGRVMS